MKEDSEHLMPYGSEAFICVSYGWVFLLQVLCVHGGLSPDVRTIDQIRMIDRLREIPHEGPFCDLVWSDPENIDSWAVSPRGAGWLFGGRPTAEFNHINNLQLICRAHQLVQEGLKYMFENNALVTVRKIDTWDARVLGWWTYFLIIIVIVIKRRRVGISTHVLLPSRSGQLPTTAIAVEMWRRFSVLTEIWNTKLGQ